MIQHLLKSTDCFVIWKNWRKQSSHYYVTDVKIKDFGVLIDRKSFFDLPVKNEKAYKIIIEMSRYNDYTTGNLLDFANFLKKLQINCNWFEQAN